MKIRIDTTGGFNYDKHNNSEKYKRYINILSNYCLETKLKEEWENYYNYYIQINTLQDLIDLREMLGEDIIIQKYKDDGILLEIYDDYRE